MARRVIWSFRATKKAPKKMNNAILFTSFVILLASCSSEDCSQLDKSFSSYDAAVSKIKETSFKIEETINTSKSSWIRGASYYSCDGSSGFLILKTDDQEYLHADVPIEIWNGFKNASSFGSYYNQNIKNRYSLSLSQ